VCLLYGQNGCKQQKDELKPIHKGSTTTRAELKLGSNDLKTVTDVAYEKLKLAIVGGSFSPGERISERSLAEDMGISTTPIKRALNRLSIEGLVEIRPRKGTFVSAYYLSSIEETGLIRAALEGIAASLAARKATDEEIQDLLRHLSLMRTRTDRGDIPALIEANAQFHQKIRDIAGNPYISQLISTVHSFDEAVRSKALIDREEARRGFEEHRAVCDAVANREGDLAEELIKKHILRTSRYVVQQMKLGMLRHESRDKKEQL
jgi:DNA-binding GntR family transcriptional regulator